MRHPSLPPLAKPLRLCAEILCSYLLNPEQEGFVQTLQRAVDEYGIGELMVHGWCADDWVTYEDFPRVRREVDATQLIRLREQLRPFRRQGVKITLSGGEPRVPEGFFAAYPEARHVTNGLLWRFFERKTAEALRQIPEADAYELFLWETPLLNDRDFFRELSWAPTMRDTIVGPDRYYSPADYLSALFAACAQGASSVGRECMLLTFSHYPWQERLLIEVLQQLDRRTPLILDHKCQSGDWDPFRPANNVILTVTDRPAMLLFDGAGEYWGQCLTPYCYPQEIQQRLWHALDHNPSIEALGMRVVWHHGHLFAAFNEVNFYTLSRLARDPYVPIEEIWNAWATTRFGPEAAPRVISALQRTDEIANRIYYIRGVWVHNHSAIADLPYLESHVINYSRSQIEWSPWDFRTGALLRELVHCPRERTIAWVLADRHEALRLNQLSLEDIAAARPALPAAEYAKLHFQFTLQRHFIQVSLPHIEAFLQYRIEQHDPSHENRARLEQALSRLACEADKVEAVYEERVPILTASAIHAYVRQVRDAVASLSPLSRRGPK
jgi:hypothetical protein